MRNSASAAGNSTLFVVESGVTAEIDNLTLTNGKHRPPPASRTMAR